LRPREARVSRRASATEQRLSYVSLGASIDLAVGIADRRNRNIVPGAEALRAQLPGDVYAHGRASPTRLVADASFQLGADDADAAGEGDLSLHLLAARDSKDNALAQSKNGSVVRDRFGDTHIPACFRWQVNGFAQGVLSPQLNFHRSGLFPDDQRDSIGRLRKCDRYGAVTTPFDDDETNA